MRTGGINAGSGPAGESTSRPGVTAGQLRVIDELFDGVDARVRDLGRVEACHDFRCREFAEHAIDLGIHGVAMLHPQVIALKSLIAGERRHAEDVRAERRPLAVVVKTEDHLAVASLIGSVGRDRGVTRSGSGWRRPAHRVVHRVPHPFAERFEERHFKRGALPGAMALKERRQDAGVRVHAACDVRDRQADL